MGKIFNLRLEHYFDANFIEDKGRVPVLLALIGTEVYKILRDVSHHPILPKGKLCENFCDILTQHFSPKISNIYFLQVFMLYEERSNF